MPEPIESPVVTGGDSGVSGTSGTATIVAPAAVTPAATTPPSDGEDWKKRFTGLQGSYEKQRQELVSARTRISEYEASIAGMDAERQAQLQKLTELEQRVGQLAPVQAQYERLQIIAKEFPDLLDWEADGLLPTVTGDELRTKLTALKAKRQAAPVAPTAPSLKGAVPSTPPSQAPQTAQDMLNAAMSAMRAGKLDEYTGYYDQWLTLSAKSNGGS
jgi:hypothetical protein